MISFDLSILCTEHNLRECGEPVRDCLAYVARIEAETREAVAEWWPGSAVDYVSAHMMALMWGESRLDRCAISPKVRNYLGLPMVKWFRSQRAIDIRIGAEAHPGYRRVSLGPGQIVLEFAESPIGDKRATLDDLIGPAAVRTVAYNLHLRRHGNRDPWGYWPGVRYDETYVRKVARIAAKLMRGMR